MKQKSQTSDRLQQEATALAVAVSDYCHFGEMAQALRAARRSLSDGELATNDADAARKRLMVGQKVVGLAREAWVAART